MTNMCPHSPHYTHPLTLTQPDAEKLNLTRKNDKMSTVFKNIQDDPALRNLAISGTFPLSIKADFG